MHLLDEQLQDEDEVVTVQVKDSHWLRPEVQSARWSLASLATFVARCPQRGNWDSGTIPDQDADDLEFALTRLYSGVSRSHDSFESTDLVLRSHAVVGAMDFLSALFRTAKAANETVNRPFVVTHAVPAALAILLHDWRIWGDAKTWELFPINFTATPLTALLIYLDTWDDYKRKGTGPTIYVRDYVIDSQGASVTVEWADSKSLDKEKLKYRKFKSALCEKPFNLKISASMARNEDLVGRA